MGCFSSKATENKTPVVSGISNVKITKNEKQKNNKGKSGAKDIHSKKPPSPKPTYAVHTGGCKAVQTNESVCCIRGVTFLNSGAVVVAAYKNNKLKLFDRTFNFVSEVELSSGVWDVCVSIENSSEVFATVPYKKEVHRVSTDPSLTALDSFRTDGFCWGITCYDGGLAVSVKVPSKPLVPPFQVHLVEFDGTFKKSIAFDTDGMTLFTEPKFLTATNDGAFLLVSDYRKDSLLCLTTEGRVIFTYMGMKSPSGVTVDDRNNIHLVSFYGTERIHKLNLKGEKIDGLPPDDEQTLFPHGISYRKKDRLLLVTTEEDNMELYSLV